MVTKLNTKRILIFLAIAIGIPWIAALAFYLTIGKDDISRAARLANIFALTGPALANLATRLITREGWGHLWLRPNFRRGWRFYLAAWLLPLLAVSVGGTIYYLVFPQFFDPNLSAARNMVTDSSPLSAASSWTLLLVSTLSVLIVGLVYYGLISFGEEFGWRAYLLPKLMEHFTGSEPASGSGKNPVPAGLYTAGARKASLLVGLIWGVWHWPGLFLFTMKVDPTMPLVYPLVYLVTSCSVSVLLAWVTLRSGSVWPAAIGHGMLNASTGLSFNMLNGTPNYLLGPQASTLIGGLGYLALALVLLFHHRAFVAGKQRTGSESALATGSPTLV